MSGNGSDDDAVFFDDWYGMRQWLLAPDPDEEPFGRDMRRYLGIITGEHNQQWRFMRTVGATVRPVVDMLRVARSLCTLFDLDTSVGQQLDFVGQWIGLTRRITVESGTLFFSWDTDGAGWDEADWLGTHDNDHETVVLDDDHYRLVLRARVASNYWDGTRQGAYDAWALVFGAWDPPYQILIDDDFERPVDVNPPNPVFFAWDEDHPSFPPQWPWALGGWDEGEWYDSTVWEGREPIPEGILGAPGGRTFGNMHMYLFMVGPVPPDRLLVALLTGGYFDMRPAGVGIGYLTTAGDDDNPSGLPIFGWDEGPEGPPGPKLTIFAWDEDPADQSPYILAGWDEGDWADLHLPVALEAEPYLSPVDIAGWDIGYWAVELQPLRLVDQTQQQPFAEAA